MNITEAKTRLEIAVFSQFDARMNELEETHKSIVWDFTREQAMVEAKAFRMQMSKSLGVLEATRKEAKSEAQAVVDRIDSLGRGYRERMEALRDHTWNQIKAHEAIDENRQKEIDMFNCHVLTINNSVDEIKEAIEFLNMMDVSKEFFGDRCGEAFSACTNARDRAEEVLQARIKYDEDGAELILLRAAEGKRLQEERRLADEAGAVERIAEEARKKVAGELQKAKDDLAAAEALIEEAGKQAREKLEKELAEVQRAKDLKIAADILKAEGLEHRATIHREAKEGLLMYFIENDLELSDNDATAIITAIKDGHVFHTTINY
jgi:hypothetical protein